MGLTLKSLPSILKGIFPKILLAAPKSIFGGTPAPLPPHNHNRLDKLHWVILVDELVQAITKKIVSHTF